MFTDSHCHLASTKFSAAELPDIIAHAQAAGVSRMVTLATQVDDFTANLELASRYPEIKSCLGIHPCDVQSAPQNWAETLAGLLADPRVCGIGETGLDYYHPAPAGWSEEDYHQRQRDSLEIHFSLATQANLPVVIHTRDRQGDASLLDSLAIYRRHADRVRAVFHCYIQGSEQAHEIIALGGLVSFGGVATFKNARDVLATVAGLPAGTFLLETDAPYLAPHPRRGTRNEPALVALTAEAIAKARGETVEQLAAHTTKTALSFFRGLA